MLPVFHHVTREKNLEIRVRASNDRVIYSPLHRIHSANHAHSRMHNRNNYTPRVVRKRCIVFSFPSSDKKRDVVASLMINCLIFLQIAINQLSTNFHFLFRELFLRVREIQLVAFNQRNQVNMSVRTSNPTTATPLVGRKYSS